MRVKGKVELGDVIAANPTWDWGSGKWIDNAGEPTFLPSPYQIALAPDTREKLTSLSNDHALFARIRSEWRGDAPRAAPALRLGPAASGAAVLADNATILRLIGQHRDLLGIDMETYGVLAAADEVRQPRPIAFSIKGVSDFADAAKSDLHQTYAAYTSAKVLEAFALQFI